MWQGHSGGGTTLVVGALVATHCRAILAQWLAYCGLLWYSQLKAINARLPQWKSFNAWMNLFIDAYAGFCRRILVQDSYLNFQSRIPILIWKSENEI
jgi:hypothetical protein